MKYIFITLLAVLLVSCIPDTYRIKVRLSVTYTNGENKTILLKTHYITEFEPHIDRLFYLQNGCIMPRYSDYSTQYNAVECGVRSFTILPGAIVTKDK